MQQRQNQQGGSFHAFSWRSSRGRRHGHLHGQHGEHWYHHPACCARDGPLVLCGRTLLAATEVVTCGCPGHSLNGGHQGLIMAGDISRECYFATATTQGCVLQVEIRASDWRDRQSTLQCTYSTRTQQQGATRTPTHAHAHTHRCFGRAIPADVQCPERMAALAASQLITHVSTGRFPGPERHRQQNRLLSKEQIPDRNADESSLLWPPKAPARAGAKIEKLRCSSVGLGHCVPKPRAVRVLIVTNGVG